MNEPAPGTRTLRVPALARVEGETALHLRVHDGTVTEARLAIYEPPRFFEAFLRGRAHTEPPDLTSRICGICPVAYQLSACRAVEEACGVRVEGPVAALRRLLYCGEWIESQTLHVHLLHAPDFLGHADVVGLSREHRPHVERGLRLKQAGNAVVELLGGRAIHPVNVRLGGFHRAPTRGELRPLAERLRTALDDAWDTVRWVAGFDFPEAECEADLLALAEPGTYAIESGVPTVLPYPEPGSPPSSRAFPLHAFPEHVAEEQVPHSTALHSRLDGRRHLTGSLARYAVSGHLLSPVARQAAREAGLSEPPLRPEAEGGPGEVCRNPYRSILVRAVEVLYAVEEALRIIGEYEPPERPYTEVPARAGVGHGATEAPRGLLYHRYVLDDAGRVADARIVPPTAQNQGAIEEDLRRLVQAALHRGEASDEALTALCERAVRNHDPCISCSAHFLELDVERTTGAPGT
ncbi:MULTISPECIES: Ni/Fe hydrogenase subunit alpha [unclassified Streptomyces]|uniref:Ni/Fe hydrogenase subunit alpha n=1 Tax=unclassified Streptomyces TaxID=2593676 RepID=UPI0022B65BBB|nr:MULTISPECIES: nickel-dependent hydrogenase large subunit [unclassified Streptomyces]MCZ7417736.1 nickel-dependent hydrogenase large subunit [Streptomyces sp. WMMC897]MCZ7432468.1 nickel-dependent hydrogenase large subunit [Streptomyces sp. WMMC1477]